MTKERIFKKENIFPAGFRSSSNEDFLMWLNCQVVQPCPRLVTVGMVENR